MALTNEEEIAQRALDRQQLAANETARHENALALQTAMAADQAARDIKGHRMENLRIAESMLLAEAQSKPADERAVSAADMVAYAQTLTNYVEG